MRDTYREGSKHNAQVIGRKSQRIEKNAGCRKTGQTGGNINWKINSTLINARKYRKQTRWKNIFLKKGEIKRKREEGPRKRGGVSADRKPLHWIWLILIIIIENLLCAYRFACDIFWPLHVFPRSWFCAFPGFLCCRFSRFSSLFRRRTAGLKKHNG